MEVKKKAHMLCGILIDKRTKGPAPRKINRSPLKIIDALK